MPETEVIMKIEAGNLVLEASDLLPGVDEAGIESSSGTDDFRAEAVIAAHFAYESGHDVVYKPVNGNRFFLFRKG